MIRRSLRIGIRLGLLTGLAFVLFKIFQSRRTSPELPDVDGWAPPSDHSPSSPGPVLVQPTMPERSVGWRDAAPGGDALEPAESVAPGPSEPFAMVEPDPAVVDASAPQDVPLDAVAGPTDEVGDPTAVAPQAEPTPTPSPRKAPTPKAARKAVERPVAAAAKTVSSAPVEDAAPAAVERSGVKKAAAKKAAAKKAAAKKAGAKKAGAKKAGAKKAGAKKAGAKRAGAKKAAGKKAGAKKSGARARAAARGTTASRRGLEGQQTAGWVEPIGGTCPSTHPVKAKMVTRIFHLPGMAAYHRMSADRCYADAAAAESDGLRAAKR